MQASLLVGKSLNISHLTLEPKVVMPEAGLNPVAMAEIAAFDARRKPA